MQSYPSGTAINEMTVLAAIAYYKAGTGLSLTDVRIDNIFTECQPGSDRIMQVRNVMDSLVKKGLCKQLWDDVLNVPIGYYRMIVTEEGRDLLKRSQNPAEARDSTR